MVEINLGLSHDEGEAQAKEAMKVLPPGTYELVCTGCKPGVYATSKRPHLEFEFEVVNDSEYSGKKLRHTCPLPENGNNSGIGFLTEVTRALGNPWTGASIMTEDYLQRGCSANVINSDPAKDTQGRTFANIKSFVS